MTVGSVDVNERGNQESSLYQSLAVFFTLFMQNSGQDGILHDLHTTVRHGSEITAQYEVAISALGRRGVDIK